MRQPRNDRLTFIRRAVFCAGLSATCLGSTLAARQDTTRTTADSLRQARLGAIVVSASTTGQPATPTHTNVTVGLAEISSRDAIVVSDLANLIPAAHIQTNSRGETLVYLRNAGERQVAVFFEGALLNIPWDNRVDLSLIPASAIAEISVAKGVPPVEYGANVLGGAVNLSTRSLRGPWKETHVVGLYGTENRREFAVSHRGRMRRFTYNATASYGATDGSPLPSGAALPFSQTSNSLRTNTDSRAANLLLQGGVDFRSGASLGLTVLHMDAKKGIAPESHLDPTQSRVRFWRYPQWQNSTVILAGEAYAGPTTFKGAAWASRFNQDIESFASATYQSVDAVQQDDDLTVGARLTVATPVGPGAVKLAANALTSRHMQDDLTLDGSGAVDAQQSTFDARYRQHIVSLGAEYQWAIHPIVNLTLGAGVDAMTTPTTGDKPNQGGFTSYSVTAGTTVNLGYGWTLRAAGGRKSRFPTMRELYGEALNHFLLNPDLREESSVLVELSLGRMGERWSGEIIPFGTFTSNTIDQENVAQPSGPSLRRRINLRGSRILGVEIVGRVLPGRYFTIDGHATIMDVTRLQDSPTDPTRLSEKPQIVARAGVAYEGPTNTGLVVETVYTGQAYSLAEDDTFVPLGTALKINLRASQKVDLSSWQQIEVFARVDNITDEVLLPQLGLPESGRSVSAGAKLTF